MDDTRMDRKAFFSTVGRACVGSCLCAAAIGEALGATGPDAVAEAKPGEKTSARAVKRMEFVDGWIRRFMGVLDESLDPATRKKIMMANGKSCFTEWIASTGQQVRQVSFEEWAKRHKDPAPDGSVRVEGRTIHFAYSGSAETGQASPEGVCLCPMVEAKPAGLSRTYCLCSTGYVKEMHERTFGRPCEVELLDSVLLGGKRCRFKITVA
jgi:hypothetical protein